MAIGRTLARLCFAAALAAFCFAGQARAQGVVADLTTHDVAVEADFSGTRVVLFGSLVGAIDPADETTSDVVIEVIGPTRPVQVRQKVWRTGIWINDGGERVERAPGYYAVVSNRALNDIALPDTFHRLGIGFAGLKTDLMRESLVFGSGDAEPYFDALLRIQRDRGLYIENPEGARFVGNFLFRASIDLGANVPLGQYDVLIYLFQEGVMTGRHQTQLLIEKRGFERFVYSIAYEQPLIYGILCVIVAGLAGLVAAYIVPRR